MRDQLKKYVELLFAGAPNAGEIKQEILQNTLDRYDDLISQGKSPEAAYRLAISGIGDINEILGSIPSQSGYGAEPFPPKQFAQQYKAETGKSVLRKVLLAIAITLYILSPIPLFVLSELGLDTIGLCGTISIVGVATALLILSPKSPETQKQKDTKNTEAPSPKSQLQNSITSAINAIGLAIYLIISFATGKWLITWLIFPIMGAVKGVVNACMDLKEASLNEN